MSSPARRRGRFLLGALALVVAGSVARRRSWGFSNFAAPVWGAGGRQSRVLREAVGEGDARPWQLGLDTALLDVDATLQERLDALADALSRPADIRRTFQEVGRALAGKGLLDGREEAIDALLPRGTLARADLDGLAAVARQVPEVLEDFRGARRKESGSSRPRKARDAKGGGLGELLSGAGLAEALEEAKNAFRSTPKGLEEPEYQVVQATGAFEVRRYQNFTVASRRMSSNGRSGSASAEGFQSLAGYLFGDNQQDRAMKMTMPVEINYDSREPEVQRMSFVMPREDVLSEAGLPKPNDPSVQVEEVPARLVAVRRFPGVATSAEVKRQRDSLIDELARDGRYVPVADDQYSVLQYNPPYTVPWRRRNEIALVVVPLVDPMPAPLAPGSDTANDVEVFPSDARAV